MTASRKDWEWAKLSRLRVGIGRANDEPCCLCGGKILYQQAGNTPEGPTAEHLHPIAFGGSIIVPLEELGVAHRRCQDRQGARISGIRRKAIAPRPVRIAPKDIAPVVAPEVERIFDERAGSNELSAPHYFSEKHPNAVDTLGPKWGKWLKEEMNFELRPWQQLVYDRALEVDADGRFVWREILVTTPRQSGKSFLIWAICLARAHFAETFTEAQECLHIANNLAAARRIHQRAWRWGAQHGLKIYRAFGQERLVWPDGSHWSICSAATIWGWSASQAVVDEAWNVGIDVVDSALKPTLVEREQPQLWLFSTANEHSTPLFPVYRGNAIAGNANMMIAEWSAPYECDYKDPKVWREASPHWSKQRQEIMQSSLHSSYFREQWLNIWPKVNAKAEWAEKWATLPLASVGTGVRAVGAVEVAFDRSCYGVAVAAAEGARIVVSAEVVATEEAALEWMRKRSPVAVLVGANMAERFIGPWQIMPATAKTTVQATPWFAAAIRNGSIGHNHDAVVNSQMNMAVISGYETGPVLTARKSKGPIPAVKAIAWAGAACAEDWFGLRSGAAIY